MPPTSSEALERLIYLLELFHRKKCSVPRDRVFSLLSLCGDDLCLAVDYQISDRALFERIVELLRDRVHICLRQGAFLLETLVPHQIGHSDPRPFLSLIVPRGMIEVNRFPILPTRFQCGSVLSPYEKFFLIGQSYKKALCFYDCSLHSHLLLEDRLDILQRDPAVDKQGDSKSHAYLLINQRAPRHHEYEPPMSRTPVEVSAHFDSLGCTLSYSYSVLKSLYSRINYRVLSNHDPISVFSFKDVYTCEDTRTPTLVSAIGTGALRPFLPSCPKCGTFHDPAGDGSLVLVGNAKLARDAPNTQRTFVLLFVFALLSYALVIILSRR